jgi:hypothetical protein
MKKLVFIALIFSLLAGGMFAADRDSFGIGTVFYGGYGYGPGILLKPPVIPFYFGLNVGVRGIPDKQYFGVSISGDYHFFDQAFPNSEKFGWFLGGGIIFSHSHFDGKNGFAGRIPAGISFSPLKQLDFVWELAPSVGFYVLDSKTEFDYGMSGILGVRYWF